MPRWEVDAPDAIAALEEHGQAEAAQWWRDSGLVDEQYTFGFPKATCEPVDGTSVDDLFVAP